MTETVKAIYEKGMLRLLEPLDLEEKQQVRIRVLTEETGPSEREAIRALLVSAGLVSPQASTTTTPSAPLTKQEQRALAARLGSASGKRASDMVIEDRGPW